MAPTEKGHVVVAIVYDFETGGLDCTKCAATQISLHAIRLDTFKLIGKYTSYIYPYNKKDGVGKPKKKVLKSKYDDDESGELMEYGKVALEVSNITMDMLYSMGKDITEVCSDICDFIESNTLPIVGTHKPFFIGQNPLFDKGFMQQIMLYTGVWDRFTKLVRGAKDFWGNFQPAQLDTIILSQLALNNDVSVINWKLESIAERLGVDLDDAHDADADVTATREIVKVLSAKMRSTDSGSYAVGDIELEKKEKLRDHFKI